MTYDFIELYTEYLRKTPEVKAEWQNSCTPEGWQYFTETAKQAAWHHKRNKHKLNFPVNLNIIDVTLPLEDQ